jgi:hypothetical protein
MMMVLLNAKFAILFAKPAHLLLNVLPALLKTTELYPMDNVSAQMDSINKFFKITQLFVANAAVNVHNALDLTLALTVQA